MSDFTAFASAIYGAIGSALGSAVYYGLAPQGTNPPYVVFARQSGVDSYYLYGGTAVGNWDITAEYMVKVIDDGLWPGVAQAAYGTVHTMMQDAALSITGFTALRSRRVQTLEYRDDDGFWHIGGIYQVEAVD